MNQKEFKGTKGDWSIQENVIYGPSISHVIGIIGKTINVDGNESDEGKANAKLIATAPDLLKALIEMSDKYWELIRKHEGSVAANENFNIKKAEKAINKAL